MHLRHGLFLTWPQKSHNLQIIYYNIYTSFNASFNPSPCLMPFRVYLLGEPTSLLVVANTHPLLSLVCQQLPHPLLLLPPFHIPEIKLQYLHRQHQQLQPSSSGTLLMVKQTDCSGMRATLSTVVVSRLHTQAGWSRFRPDSAEPQLAHSFGLWERTFSEVFTSASL